jgi:hypothetical protein
MDGPWQSAVVGSWPNPVAVGLQLTDPMQHRLANVVTHAFEPAGLPYHHENLLEGTYSQFVFGLAVPGAPEWGAVLASGQQRVLPSS